MTAATVLELAPLALVAVACGLPAYRPVNRASGDLAGLACLALGWVPDRRARLALVAWLANPLLGASYLGAALGLAWLALVAAVAAAALGVSALRVRNLLADTSGRREDYRPALGAWTWLAALALRAGSVAFVGS